MKIKSDFSKTIHTRREWSEIFNLESKKTTNLEFYILQNYHSKVKEKNFLSKQKLREFILLDLPCRKC